jgi:hypothetical protein
MSASVFDQTWQRERDRLRAFEDLFDPGLQAPACRAGHPPRLAGPALPGSRWGRQPRGATARHPGRLR